MRCWPWKADLDSHLTYNPTLLTACVVHQHAPAYASTPLRALACPCERQHAHACASMSMRAPACHECASMPMHALACPCVRQHAHANASMGVCSRAVDLGWAVCCGRRAPLLALGHVVQECQCDSVGGCERDSNNPGCLAMCLYRGLEADENPSVAA
eukprot:353849-Chlamydomonas_euryale.AAC.9